MKEKKKQKESGQEEAFISKGKGSCTLGSPFSDREAHREDREPQRRECSGRPVEGRTKGDKQGSVGYLAALPSHPRRTPAGVENGWGWNWAFRGPLQRGLSCNSGGGGTARAHHRNLVLRGSQWARLCPCELWECARASRLPTHGGGAEI